MASVASSVVRLAGPLRAGLLLALLILPLDVHPVVASEKPVAPDLVWTWSMYGVPSRSIHTEIATIWVPDGRVARDGLRVRLSGGGGRSFEPEGDTFKAVGAFEIGWRQRFERMSLTGWIGVEHRAEEGPATGSRTGARATVDVIWTPRDGMFHALNARYATIRDSFAATFTTGWEVPLGVKIGPEIGVSGDRFGTALRVGVGVFGIPALGGDLSFSAGILRDERGRVGSYLSMFVGSPF